MKSVVTAILVVLVVVGGVFAWKAQHPKAVPPAAPVKQTSTLYIMVPMGVFMPFSMVADEFGKKHPEVKLDTTVDTPEAMAQMVEENKRKPDLFISPGGHEIEVLREKGWIEPETETAFGSYQLAIVVPRANPGKVKTLEDLLNPEVKAISISKPDLNAACYAARQSLQNLGIWDKLEKAGKLKVTGCCNESFKWILDGRAEANVQFLGCPMDEKAAVSEESKVSFACKFPLDTYYVPRNVIGIVKGTKQHKLAQEFIDLMTSPDMIKKMHEKRLRNDQNLPATPGPWGPAQEANPKERAG